MEFSQGNWSLGVVLFVGFMAVIALIVFIWGFFVEMNLRMPKITITSTGIHMKQLLGFGTQRSYLFTDIDGFVIKKFNSRGKENEYLYLIKERKAIGIFSSLYLKNYHDIKEAIQPHLRQYQE